MACFKPRLLARSLHARYYVKLATLVEDNAFFRPRMSPLYAGCASAPLDNGPPPDLPGNVTFFLDQWVIHDSYRDFAVGEEAEFPIVISWLSEPEQQTEPIRRLQHVEMERYQISGQVVAAVCGSGSISGWSVDAGINICFERAGEWNVGDFISGEALLNLPYPHIAAGFCDEESMPPNLYRWKIDSIDYDGKAIERTNWQEDRRLDGFSGFYLVTCRLVDEPPRKYEPDDDMLVFVE